MKIISSVFYSLLLIVMLTTACEKKQALKSGKGFIPVNGGKVWYKIVGEGGETPLLLLHGGPGVPSYYLNPLEALGADRPIIFFDQLGCGRSDHHADTTLMTVDHFVEQVEELRKNLKLDEFYLYGSSWGTMLGVDYYLKYPQAIKGMILSSPCLSAELWSRDADTLITMLPDSIQVAIRTNTKNGTFDSPDYLQASEVYYQNFVVRNPSADVDSSFAGMNAALYTYMWGPSEFTATGTLKNYDQTNRLKDIAVPTLFIAGEFDEARPSTVQYYQSLVPGSRFAVMKKSGHLTMQDNPEQDIATIRNFLQELER
ncbi:MAG: proline iminopeptidase-family hydrolase [Cyclobacteriaceae bacterium]|nr:proline iminopeptidase-family hydrolase [Cyclobacteriaceae bacterium]